MNTRQPFKIIEYDERFAWETVRMWRASMEKALGIKDHHTWAEQLDYLQKIVAEHRVYLAIEEPTDKVVGMMAVGGTELDQLYIHVDYQGLGLGTRLLNLAKELSPGKLQLYTFAVNTGAQSFYEKHGFTIIGRGIEKNSQMADIRYEWMSDIYARRCMMNQRQIPVKAVAEIVINVVDMDKMQRFYEEVLGFTFFRQHPAEDPTIVFLTINALDSPLGHGGHPQLFALIDVHRHRPGQFQGIDQRLTSLNHIAFEIDPDDFESAKQYLLDRGLAVQIQTFPHMNARALFFTDPEDNRLEYICHDETLARS